MIAQSRPDAKNLGLPSSRELWATRMGLILAMAGNAIGLGNFLRFPVKAAQNGGGAFMIPYFIAFLLLGIPLMWIEWTIGRRGGQYGYGTSVGAFGTLATSRHGARIANCLGVLGIAIPLIFAIYYLYIESWTLAYSVFSITGRYVGLSQFADMRDFLLAFQGRAANEHFSGLGMACVFFFITLALNLFILLRGLAAGIERLAKIALPVLFLFAFVLVIRVWTLGTPDPTMPENSIQSGIAWLWNPDFSAIGHAKTWLAAAGQVFFTLSLGTGSILTYASYLKKRDDIVLTGLTTSMTNEFAEVILGGSIAIPAAVAFFGIASTESIAQGGAYDLGFVAMPIIFQKMPLGNLLGMLWFLLLFFAGITSSVALCCPMMAFLQDQMKLSRTRSVGCLGCLLALFCLPVIFFLKHGVLDEMDFWIGTFGLVLFGLIEVILFAWIFGIKRGWEEMHNGADVQIPRPFKLIMKYLTPLYLMGLLIFWGYQDGLPVLTMTGRDITDIPYLWLARFLMLALIGLVTGLVIRAYRRGKLTD